MARPEGAAGDAKLYGTGADRDALRRAFTAGDVEVAVYGLGKMGLPLATVYAEVTGNVSGVDVDAVRVAAIARGDCPVAGEPGLDEALADVVASGALVPTADGAAAASRAGVHVLIVPTTLTEASAPDLSALRAAAETVGTGLERGDLVVLESTAPPGTCRDVLQPLLSERSGLDPSAFGLACCPERTMSGRALADIRRSHPRVVGGVDGESTAVAATVYGELTDNEVLTVSDATTAECVKLFEGVYRDVNIALANELGTVVDDLGVDVVEAIERANTQPYCDIHRPGAGVGGHCIPFYPHFLTDALESSTPLVETARRTNDEMPEFVVRTVVELFADSERSLGESSVAVLGVTYRPGVDEVRASPAYPITARLSGYGATVYAVDPVREDLSDFDAEPATIADLGAIDPDAVVLVTAHEAFQGIDWDALDPVAVVDGRQALDLEGTGHTVYTVGSGLSTEGTE